MATIRPEFHTSVVSQILDEMLYQRSSYYYFLGKIDAWNIGDETPPIAPINSTNEDVIIRNNMVYLRKIEPNDVSLVSTRYDWNSGDVYDCWDHTIDMSTRPFYVVTDDFYVYKCLDNNNGAVSTVKPTSTSLFPFRTSDGYLWKYMFTVPSFKRTKFQSRGRLPVQRALTDTFYNKGAVEQVVVSQPGSGYFDVQLTTVSVSGTTTGSGALAEITEVDSFGAITEISVISGGSNYTKGAYVTITSGDLWQSGASVTSGDTIYYENKVYIVGVSGTLGENAPTHVSGTELNGTATLTYDRVAGFNAVIKAQTSDGEVNELTIINPGVGYTVGDTVNILVGGAELLPVVSRTIGTEWVSGNSVSIGQYVYYEDRLYLVSISGTLGSTAPIHLFGVELNGTASLEYSGVNRNGSITSVKIINPGAGYTESPTLTVNQISGGQGTGIYGNSAAVLTSVAYDGSIVQVNIEDPGVDYLVDTDTTVTVVGDGFGARFTPIVYNGKLVDIVVENSGKDYTYIELSVVGQGEGAAINAVLAASDFISDQSLVEQVAVRGAIYSVVVTNPGESYSDYTTVSIVGDGTDATAEAVIVNGQIVQVNMLTYGQGYTYATIVASDPNRPTPNNYQSLEAYVTLPPTNGHGYDAVKELYADTLAIFTLLKGDQELNLLAQDYRQYGLIQNPTDLITKERFTSSSIYAIFEVQLDTLDELVPDDIIVNNGISHRVVSIDSNSSTVKLQQLCSIFHQPSGTFQKQDTQLTFVIESVLSGPGVDKYSGNLMYTTNNAPFTPTGENSIAIRTYITL